MRKIVLYTSVLIYTASPAIAMDSVLTDPFTQGNHRRLEQKAGWVQNAIGTQSKATSRLRLRVEELEKENEQLRNSISSIRLGRRSHCPSTSAPRVQKLIDENKRLLEQLSQSYTQNSYTQQKPSITNAQINVQIKDLQEKLEQTQKSNLDLYVRLKEEKEKKGLKAKLEGIKKDIKAQENTDEKTKILHQQNESLRATIKAQSETLLSADNASQTAEHLLIENATLQNKLSMQQKNKDVSVQNIKAMKKHIKKLDRDIEKRELLIKKMLIARSDTFSEFDMPSLTETKAQTGQVESLKDNSGALLDALNKEKQMNLAYRKKIAEYQKEIKNAQE